MIQETSNFPTSQKSDYFPFKDLEQLSERGLIQVVDLLAAKTFCSKLKLDDANLVFAYLFSASRQGHLCVEIKQSLYPPLKQIWVSETSQLSVDEEKEFSGRIVKAFESIDDSFFYKHTEVKKEKNLLYLMRNYMYEHEILSLFEERENDSPSIEVKPPTIGPELFEEQKRAVEISLQHALSFVTGGPGVGKTYTASRFIDLFLKEHPTARIALVAPTGKAVANLQEYFLKAASNQPSSSSLEVYTLHKLFNQKIYSYLPFDLILVDESSMMSLLFMHKILKYAKPHSRIIFLGDPNQLPPIEAGFIFQDLLELTKHRSHLSKCIRSEFQSLVDAATSVRLGDEEKFFEYIESGDLFFSLSHQEKGAFYNRILACYPSAFSGLGAKEIFAAFQNFKLLSPVRKGTFGVDQINKDVKQFFQKRKYHPILITQNDYRMELFNGDIGVLVDQKYALFPSRNKAESYYKKEEELRFIPIALLPQYEYAYCVSVHKSQGSEYAHVGVVLPSSSEVFGREMLYTAITRAKKSFEIFGDRHTLKKIFKSTAKRFSGVQARNKNG